MKTFIDYLNEIKKLKKENKLDEAIQLSQDGIKDLFNNKDESWFMMHYQISEIFAKEKNWHSALVHMSIVIHHLQRIGGKTHEKYIEKLLKKINKESIFDEYILVSKCSATSNLKEEINKLLESK